MSLARRNLIKMISVYHLGLLLLLMIVVFSIVPAYAEDEPGDIIVTHQGNFNLEEPEQKSEDTVFEPASFHGLPLWVQVAYWSGSIGTIIKSIIIAPMVIRKRKVKNRFLAGTKIRSLVILPIIRVV
ncbi:hypothetical protein [Methanocella conradii]|uniref:hypothetical protein n=1 Tax=Methanocella conradii TaxID=1175444 RepID=UPI00117EDFD3|nr:hypothetical protein [Methanocella conradii]